ncbi:MAG TPA: trehalose-6-phosphate synthase, partial [Rudaea sp.]
MQNRFDTGSSAQTYASGALYSEPHHDIAHEAAESAHLHLESVPRPPADNSDFQLVDIGDIGVKHIANAAQPRERKGNLVVVSNRVAIPRDMRAGGLAIGLKSALAEHGGIWFGWSGKVAKEPGFRVEADPVHPIRYATIDLDHDDYRDYYTGFANRVLWPLFHYRLHLLDFHRETLAAYRRVSALFADRLMRLLTPEDTIWIHDYHLIPLGAALRARGVTAKIGFFLHTPLAPPQLLASLPNHRDLMSTFSAYDLVGFQTQGDVESFQQYFQTELGAVIEADGTIVAGRDRFRADVFPIGIDTQRVEQMARRAETSTAVKRLRDSLSNRALLIGVDRLDYSKGLPQRFNCFGRLLEQHPELKRAVMLLQIAPPTRGDVPEYSDLRRELERIAGAINGEHAEPDWTPIRYLNKSYQLPSLVGYYRCARVGLVTPLRDGMNLVAKEYLAAQNEEDPGVLVLSRFAGAANELTEALLVNPFDSDQVVCAIRQAIAMPVGERRRRWQLMME